MFVRNTKIFLCCLLLKRFSMVQLAPATVSIGKDVITDGVSFATSGSDYDQGIFIDPTTLKPIICIPRVTMPSICLTETTSHHWRSLDLSGHPQRERIKDTNDGVEASSFHQADNRDNGAFKNGNKNAAFWKRFSMVRLAPTLRALSSGKIGREQDAEVDGVSFGSNYDQSILSDGTTRYVDALYIQEIEPTTTIEPGIRVSIYPLDVPDEGLNLSKEDHQSPEAYEYIYSDEERRRAKALNNLDDEDI